MFYFNMTLKTINTQGWIPGPFLDCLTGVWGSDNSDMVVRVIEEF